MARNSSICKQCGFEDWVQADQCKQCGALLFDPKTDKARQSYYGPSKSQKLILRGAVGGLIGAPVFLTITAIYQKLMMGYVPYGGGLHIAALPLFLAVGGVFGMAVGGIIWFVAAKVRANPSALLRAIIGACLILVLHEILRLLSLESQSGIKPPTPAEAFLNALAFVISFGVVPGIVARPRNAVPISQINEEVQSQD